MQRRLILLGVLASVWGASGSARATIMLKLDLKQLVGRADKIFMGTPIRAESRWTKDTRHIVTDVVFRVTAGIQGSAAGEEITVTRLGGTVDGIGMQVAGSPMFGRDESVVLFTEQRGASRYVVGMQQGAFRTYKDLAGRVMVRTDLSGLTLTPNLTQMDKLDDAPQAAPAQPLADFLRQVKSTIAACAKEAKSCVAP